jgi:hypothetical protein
MTGQGGIGRDGRDGGIGHFSTELRGGEGVAEARGYVNLTLLHYLILETFARERIGLQGEVVLFERVGVRASADDWLYAC